MSPDFKYDEFPGGFAHCFNEKCQREPLASAIRLRFAYPRRGRVSTSLIRKV